MSTTTTDKCIDVCNSLLRGEISAIETYNQAIAKFRSEPEVGLLEKIRSDHIESANRLRRNIHEMGGEPSNDSGAWGTFAKSVEGAAKLFGDKSALSALAQGEEHGRKDYEDALKNDDVLPGCKDMIRTELLPRVEGHISTIRNLRRAQ